ncbi:hypothetical protein EsDP_00004783 [Epichloe bromicola]|uniref:Uncharacterized protein n=1 Tax=Epichloe bromicola TaxID=79588 RepID=A0ABQ0CSQ3_9HYPO
MLNRTAYTRSLRLAPIQRRPYTAKPGGEAAEFTANKDTSSTTKYVALGATVLVFGLYGAMAGNPRKAAKEAARNDPGAVSQMNPPHDGHEGNSLSK